MSPSRVAVRIIAAATFVAIGTGAVLKSAGWLQPGHCESFANGMSVLTNPTWEWDGFYPRFWCTLLGTAAVAAAGCTIWARAEGRPAEVRAWTMGNGVLTLVALALVPGFLLWCAGPGRAEWKELMGSHWNPAEDAYIRTEYAWRAAWAAAAAVYGAAASFGAARFGVRSDPRESGGSPSSVV